MQSLVVLWAQVLTGKLICFCITGNVLHLFLQELSVYQGKLCEFLGGPLLLQFIKDTPRSLLFEVQKKANLHPAC